jgi:two-component system, NtrC family, C4-dicarboxylate transport sensor histidine kinase DctB
MTSKPAAPRSPQSPRSRRTGLWVLLAGLVLSVGLAAAVHRHSHNEAMAELTDRAGGTLQLAVAALDGQIRRYDRLPGLIAQNPVVRDLMALPDNPARVQAANLFLQITNQLLQSSDIYVMALDGVTIAHSNFAGPASFIGGNFAFRPYFQDALTQGVGRFYALGTTSGQRGYYFGAPVLQDDQNAGVLVFKIDLDAIEDSWRNHDYQVLVTDPEGVVFLSSRDDWAYATLMPQTAAQRARTQATRRYADAPLRQLDTTMRPGPSGADLWMLEGTRYVVQSQRMDEADWTVHVLVPMSAADVTAATRAALAALLAGLAGLGTLVFWQHRRRLDERLAMQAEARALLERRVVERTAELATVNTRLKAEVSERRATEARLRATQEELIQAGKLAALGQMSAALSHEFNQPLGAARNFTENAQLLIDRGRIDEARGALDRILSLIDRMAELSRHLRNFARKPNAQLSDVALPDAVAAALEILGWRLRAQGVTLEQDVPPLIVRAGPVRLQQVLVNILSNALDALDAEGATGRVIQLAACAEGNQAVLSVTDTGPGIAPSLIERIFDPFFSTKGVGKGLGLGLSISYNIVHDFGGTLTAANAPGGGAVFTLTLPMADARADARAEAAE